MIGATKTTYQLKNLATGRRIGADGIEVSRFIPRKLWFEEVSEPSPESIALTEPTPFYQETDPYHLREPNLPSAVKIWDTNNGIDVYTTRTKEWYEMNGVATQRDHKLEVPAHHGYPRATTMATRAPPPPPWQPRQIQIASLACLDAFPFIHGDPDPRAATSVTCAFKFLNGLGNLNNTDSGLNRDWKGRVVTSWCRAYTKSQGNSTTMKVLLQREDIGMSSMLRDSMKASAKDNKPWTNGKIFLEDRIFLEPTRRFSVMCVEPGGGENRVPERYAPNWARRVEKEMSRSVFAMVDILNERDGETGVDELAESLKTISSVMSITGSA